MNAPDTRQFINTEKPAGLRANYNDALVHKADTTPNPIVPKQWREPLQVPAYAQEPRESKWPSLYALVGAAFIGFISVYGFVEICFLMWHAFLQAIR
jgi:hypothetical protein